MELSGRARVRAQRVRGPRVLKANSRFEQFVGFHKRQGRLPLGWNSLIHADLGEALDTAHNHPSGRIGLSAFLLEAAGPFRHLAPVFRRHCIFSLSIREGPTSFDARPCIKSRAPILGESSCSYFSVRASIFQNRKDRNGELSFSLLHPPDFVDAPFVRIVLDELFNFQLTSVYRLWRRDIG